MHICIADHLETTPLLSEYEWGPSALQNSYAISHPTARRPEPDVALLSCEENPAVNGVNQFTIVRHSVLCSDAMPQSLRFRILT